MKVEMIKNPKRIQRKRTKGWRMPENTVYVGRPTRWSNPFRIGVDGDAETCVRKYKSISENFQKNIIKTELAGKNLACWCPHDQPCHADVLLKIANEEEQNERT